MIATAIDEPWTIDAEEIRLVRRDQFAAAALQGLLANPDIGRILPSELAQLAWQAADCMLDTGTNNH